MRRASSHVNRLLRKGEGRRGDERRGPSHAQVSAGQVLTDPCSWAGHPPPVIVTGVSVVEVAVVAEVNDHRGRALRRGCVDGLVNSDSPAGEGNSDERDDVDVGALAGPRPGIAERTTTAGERIGYGLFPFAWPQLRSPRLSTSCAWAAVATS
jgi:hypothetical protein